MSKLLSLPVSITELAELRLGQAVSLSGSIYTMRDAGHQRALQYLETHGVLPFELAGQALFYAGPTPLRNSCRPFAAIGPTTAARMDFAAPALYRAGITLTLGKGSRSAAVEAACRDTGSLYLATVGGAAALLASHVVAAELIAWPDLGPEALYRLTLEDFPAFVCIDNRGVQLSLGELLPVSIPTLTHKPEHAGANQ